MSNTTINRVNATLTPEAVQTVKNAIAGIQQALPFLVGLTPNERVSLPKISVSNKVFTEDAIKAAVNNPDLLPGFIKAEDLKTDLDLFHALDELVLLVQQTAEKLADTQLLAGSEAYTSALTIYKIFGAAAGTGVAGSKTVYEQLRQRFTGMGPVAPAPEAPAA
ncbi:hypothetical protein ACTJIJ_26220 [Niabella sp. 22666]|uniref:hypothetical protein n=1 Tax=Niabella sp. 22666 TaxID=3453954 RepID=UPI003F87A229